MMYEYSKNNLSSLAALLSQLSAGDYVRLVAALSQATIGQHVRHIAEMYQVLIGGYEGGCIAYDQRKRDRTIESDIAIAMEALEIISLNLQKPDKSLEVIYEINGEAISLQSNYEREVMYNMEHAIHHMALIKVAVIGMMDIQLPKEFGVAPATLQYRAQCVQ
jgi:uncharacterized damage-inducible protein DinB